MKETKEVRVNRCFGGNCPKNSEQQREQKIKEVLSTATQRKRANREIEHIRERYHHKKTILELLVVIKRECSALALAVALERVERRLDAFTMDDLAFFKAFKASLRESE